MIKEHPVHNLQCTTSRSEVGCLKGVKDVIELNYILLTQDQIKCTQHFFYKHDIADSQPDVFKTSSLYRSAYVQWNERYILFLCIKCYTL
jgi:hypothetical protein